MSSNDERAQSGDTIEISTFQRTDYGTRMQVATSDGLSVVAMDNRMRVTVAHGDYKVVKRCGRPAVDEAPKKRGRPSNAELAARAAAERTPPAVEVKAPVVTPKPIVTDADVAGLEAALYDVAVTRKVEQSLSDPRPNIPHDTVMANAKALLDAKKQPALTVDESKVTVQTNDVSVEAAAMLVEAAHHDHRLDKLVYPGEIKPFTITQEQIDLMTTHTEPRGFVAGIKHDAEKVRMDLLDPVAIEQLAAVLTFGAQKYAAHNWRKGIDFSRLSAATLRHVFAFMRGEDLDPESGLPHIAHAMCCCMFLLGLAPRAEFDDRVKAAA